MGGGGAVHIRPDTKSGGGCRPALQTRYTKRGGGGGGGGGCLAEEGEVPYMKGGGCNPQNPLLDPPLPDHNIWCHISIFVAWAPCCV